MPGRGFSHANATPFASVPLNSRAALLGRWPTVTTEAPSQCVNQVSKPSGLSSLTIPPKPPRLREADWVLGCGAGGRCSCGQMAYSLGLADSARQPLAHGRMRGDTKDRETSKWLFLAVFLHSLHRGTQRS